MRNSRVLRFSLLLPLSARPRNDIVLSVTTTISAYENKKPKVRQLCDKCKTNNQNFISQLSVFIRGRGADAPWLLTTREKNLTITPRDKITHDLWKGVLVEVRKEH